MNYLHAEVKAVDSTGSWTAVASSNNVDRDGERVVAGGLRWRTESIPVHCGHNFKVESLVGRAKPYYESNGMLLVDGKFNTTSLAQQTRQAVLDGSLSDMSIVFIDAQRRKGEDGVPEVTSAELVAVDWVTIPSNVDARVLAARAYGSGSPTVAEAQQMARQVMLDLAKLDLDQARAGIDRLDATKGRRPEAVTPADLRAAIRDTEKFLDDLRSPR